MEIKIKGLHIHYLMEGDPKQPKVLLLHGWGASSKAFLPVISSLSQKYCVYALDFPGFGDSEEPNENYDVLKYAELTKEFIEKLKLESVTLIGHSFGGRVIMKLVGDLGVKPAKIVLVDSAGIKPKRKASYYFKVYSYKLGKKMIQFFLPKEKAQICIEKMQKNAGSEDYKQASPVMKKIFVQVVNEDLKYCLPKITVPTLLIWGEKDEDTPLKDAKIIEKLIPDCGLVVIKGAGHFSYLDNLYQFLLVVDTFIKGSD